MHAHAAGALHERLDDYRGNLALAEAQRMLKRFGNERNDIRLEKEWLVVAEECRVAADGHGAERVAVVTAFEADEARPPRLAALAPVLVRHLQRDFDRRTAVVRIE